MSSCAPIDTLRTTPAVGTAKGRTCSLFTLRGFVGIGCKAVSSRIVGSSAQVWVQFGSLRLSPEKTKIVGSACVNFVQPKLCKPAEFSRGLESQSKQLLSKPL